MGKIVEETMLIMVNTGQNNNKFYHVTLNEDSTVSKRWGRVGTEGTITTDRTGKTGYDRAIKAKEKKGYKVAPIVSTGVSVKTNNTDHLEEVAQKYLAKDTTDTTISDLIKRLVTANQHQIMEQSGGLIKVTDDGTVKTALGIVDLKTIAAARQYLAKMRTTKTLTANRKNLEEYLTLIPQSVGMKRGWDEEFIKTENLDKQTEFLDQLEDAVKWGNKTKAANSTDSDDDADKFDITKHADLFRFKLDKIDNNSDEFKRINKLYEKTRNSMHSNARNLRLLNVFAVEDVKGEVDYQAEKTKLGNVKEFWHGTKASNLLSILTKGLFVPNAGSGVQIQGRMFGDGVYFSDQSTKSLLYSTGYWNGTHTNSNVFMLLNDVVMGNEFRPSRWDASSLHKAHKGADILGKAYNSISIKGGTCNVRNNEMIIWNTKQICIKYICEFGA
jgi:poly [ADP-ribose] polymerase